MQIRSKSLLIVFLCMGTVVCHAQGRGFRGLVSGPMLGQVEIRTASIWMELSQEVKSVEIQYWRNDQPGRRYSKKFVGILQSEFNPVKIDIGGLDMNSAYTYRILLDGIQAPVTGSFTTKDLWQWRKPAPDFSFLAGSCAYFNESRFDRPGKPYGGDSTIFETMAKTPASFMLWLGDNWYTREADYFSEWGLRYRASHDRSLQVLQPFWRSMSHFAIWDDHDFGPDNSDASYLLKDPSRKIFMDYWCNPSFGENGKGIYTKITYSDVDIFLTDDRYFRSSNLLLDSLDGKPNPEKHFFGKMQMDWLENALSSSEASFKIIVVGSQVLNPMLDDFECFRHYSAEYGELMDFLNRQKIQGVLFLTGDRHHSEVIRVVRPGSYTLYDITCSPLTSGIARVRGDEINNPSRLAGTLVEEENFSRFHVSGKPGNRKLDMEFIDLKGISKAHWSVNESELKTPAR